MAAKKEKSINITADKANSLAATASYISVPKGTTIQISGAERKWKGSEKTVADPTFVYAFMNRVAGREADLRAIPGIDFNNVFTFRNTREGQPMHDLYLRELEVRERAVKTEEAPPQLTLADIPGLLAVSADKANWITKSGGAKGKGKGKGAGVSRGPTKSLGQRLRDLRPGYWTIVSGLKDNGVGARDAQRPANPHLLFVEGLPMAASKREQYDLALDLLAGEGVTEWAGRPLSYYRDNFGRSQGGTAAVATVSRSPLAGPASPGRQQVSLPAVGSLSSPFSA